MSDQAIAEIRAAITAEAFALRSAATKAGLAVAKSRGAVLGNIVNLAEGHKRGAATNARSADTFAANVMPIVREIQASGRTTLQAIADALNDQRVATVRGGRWYPSTVKNLLERGHDRSNR